MLLDLAAVVFLTFHLWYYCQSIEWRMQHYATAGTVCLAILQIPMQKRNYTFGDSTAPPVRTVRIEKAQT